MQDGQFKQYNIIYLYIRGYQIGSRLTVCDMCPRSQFFQSCNYSLSFRWDTLYHRILLCIGPSYFNGWEISDSLDVIGNDPMILLMILIFNESDPA